MGAWGSRAAFTPLLLSCYGITILLHFATVSLNTLVPFHLVDLGGSRTQIGLAFSMATLAAMGLRPMVGGWVDRYGARRVVVPGVIVLGITSLGLHAAHSPTVLIVMMAGLGISAALISTPASVVSATHSESAHRGEAIGTYYLASSIAIAVGAPLGFGVRALGGMTLEFVMLTVLALAIATLVPWMPGRADARRGAGGPGWRFVSVSALPISGALVLATLGQSSIYGFVPLYALGRGQGAALAAFFTVYPVCLTVGRALLRGLPDRIGHGRAALAAMALSAVAFACLALPPSMVTLCAAGALLGAGGAVMYPALVALVVARADESDRGLAVGTLSGSWDLGIVVGSAVVGVVADHVGFAAAFGIGAVGCALGCIALTACGVRR